MALIAMQTIDRARDARTAGSQRSSIGAARRSDRRRREMGKGRRHQSTFAPIVANPTTTWRRCPLRHPERRW
jgi:hypothetical protein